MSHPSAIYPTHPPHLLEDSDTDADLSTDDDDNQDDSATSVEESCERAPALRRLIVNLMDTMKDHKNVAQSPSTPTRVQGATLDWKSHLQKQGVASAPMQDTIVATAPKVDNKAGSVALLPAHFPDSICTF
mgnify:CR=1 FL=1